MDYKPISLMLLEEADLDRETSRYIPVIDAEVVDGFKKDVLKASNIPLASYFNINTTNTKKSMTLGQIVSQIYLQAKEISKK